MWPFSSAMSAVTGVPMMVATMPRWSHFSSRWLSGYTWVMADIMCVTAVQAQKTARAAPPGSSAAEHRTDTRRKAIPGTQWLQKLMRSYLS